MSSNRRWLVCATDLSERSKEMAAVAAKLALARSEDLQLVHVNDVKIGDATEAKRRLENEARRLRQSGIEVEPLLLNGGHAAKTLVDHVRREPPSMVVVAAGTKGPVDRWALGSFSERVAESSPVPTLVVRNPGMFHAWNWTKSRLNVLLALDTYSTSDVVLRWAKEFRRGGPCDFIACHVNWRVPTESEMAVAPGRPVNPSTLQLRLERELRRKVRDQMGDDAASVIVRPYFGDAGPCIAEIADEVKAHVVAVGAHQRHGLSRLTQFSVSRELLHLSSVNIMCVPVTAKFDPSEAHIPEFRRVLVATDFSELGNSAVPFACGACCIGGLVRIVHIASPKQASQRKKGVGVWADLRQRLRLLVPVETGARCQPPEFEVRVDRDPARGICEEAEEFGADMVCLASHGLGASRALHGSTAKAVLKKIKRPLLVIRRPEE